MRFHLRKSVVTFAKKIIKVNGTFIELWFQQTLVSRKRNSKIGRQVFKGLKLTLVSQNNAYVKICCESLWRNGNSPRTA